MIIGNDDSNLAAMLPFGGQTVLEFQVRVAHSAGANHIVVMVSKLPADMVAAFDRLRASGINVDVARDPRDAADRIHPDERLLVMTDGVVVDRYTLAELVRTSQSSLFTVLDQPANAAFERIDSTERWCGMAMIDGKLLRETVAMLGDWTLAPTLLRAALQAGATRIRLSEYAVIGRATDIPTARALAGQMAAGVQAQAEGPVVSYVARPIAARVVPVLLNHSVPLDLIAVFPLILSFLSLLFLAFGWVVSGYLVFLLAMVPAVVGNIIATISARQVLALSIYDRTKHLVFCIGLMVLGWHEYRQGQSWGSLIAALWSVSLLLQRRKPSHSLLHIELALVVMILAVLVGLPLWGMGLIILAFVASEEVSARASN